MKLRGLPPWLCCDLIAQRWASDRSRPPSAEEDRMLASLLACAEGWLEFAIARRAFRLAGLNASSIA